MGHPNVSISYYQNVCCESYHLCQHSGIIVDVDPYFISDFSSWFLFVIYTNTCSRTCLYLADILFWNSETK